MKDSEQFSTVVKNKHLKECWKYSTGGKQLDVQTLANNLGCIVDHAAKSGIFMVLDDTLPPVTVSVRIENLPRPRVRAAPPRADTTTSSSEDSSFSEESSDSDSNFSGMDISDIDNPGSDSEHQQSGETGDEPPAKRVKFCGPTNYQFVLSDMVAVAFEDNWYPGIVNKVISCSIGEVKYMRRAGRSQDGFIWPSRTDMGETKRVFVIASSLQLSTTASGRQWKVENVPSLNRKYNRFYNEYFKV